MASPKPSSERSRKRKQLGCLLALAALIVIVVIYETGQELHKQQALIDTDIVGLAPADTSDSPSPEKALAEIRSYYRSHDLPSGWSVGEAVFAESDKFEVAIVFAPGVTDSRHGKPAPAGEITPQTACPLDDAVWSVVGDRALWILVSDKTGPIDSFVCDRASGPT